MRVGLALDSAGDPSTAPDDARQAEALGYDLISCGEHLFFHGPTSNAFLTLSAAAAVTERVRLLSSLTILPLYPMAMAAKFSAQLDRLSGGRFELGIGVGGEYPAEFAAVGSDVSTRGRRTDEALEGLVRLLEGGEFEVGGGQGVALNPRPVQTPRPPIWVGGRQRNAMRRAGRFADVWMPYMVSPSSFARSLGQARDFAVEAGREPTDLRGALFIWGSVDDDAAAARRETVDTVSRIYDQDFEPLADRYLVHGTPDTVAARIAEYAGVGADIVVFSPACVPERRSEVASLFAESVLPQLTGDGIGPSPEVGG